MLGERIKLARRKAGYSLRNLADRMGGRVSAQAIGKYERGEMVPGSDNLIALSRALEVSVPYLLDSQGIELTGVDFRAQAGITGAERARVQTEVLEWVERYLQIERILELDDGQWEMPFAEPRKLASVQQAESLAEEVRNRWNLGWDPIPNVTELFEEQGFKVLVVGLPAKVSGFTCLVHRSQAQSAVPVVVVNEMCSIERRRLTMVHELGHRLIDPEPLCTSEEEKAATRFAGAFLMPKEHLIRECGRERHKLSYQELIDLKQLYKVSGAALLVRLRDIGVISDAYLTYAFQSFARTWRSQEPESLERDPTCAKLEPAQRFERLCHRALAEGLISLSKAAELLRRPVKVVESELKGPVASDADHHQ
ncbi:helix-turn-helix domain-containing protein [Gloeobacter violaceus]|uniref:Gll0267 protein n=1 Tax=Gloeobacter violaceus (strain ATCC 29082 / PCC 7421) TaxID=251221 RepID=Q7NNZ1_GLOVI|nr:XRE family transcriptional regulator [Gloeobacter violaceus]BAC88208.1 gll0267 [Gloeobacter violaceus PCC 7421]